jgi:hypothetical protein
MKKINAIFAVQFNKSLQFDILPVKYLFTLAFERLRTRLYLYPGVFKKCCNVNLQHFYTELFFNIVKHKIQVSAVLFL